MTVNLTIPIECGKDTCASEPGKFCKYVFAKSDGSLPRCSLFNKLLYDKNGSIFDWLLRCKQCKEADK